MIEKNTNLPLDQLRKKIILIGFIGIFVFASAIIGAVISQYISNLPDYAHLRKTILMFSLIDLFLGIGILLVFRNNIISYKAQKDKQNELSDRI